MHVYAHTHTHAHIDVRIPHTQIIYEENVHGLTGDALKKRKIKEIDISDSSDIKKEQYDAETDPSRFR